MVGRLLSFIQTAISASSQKHSAADGSVQQKKSESTVLKEKLIYVEVLHLHPIIVHVTFIPTGELAEKYSRCGSGFNSDSKILVFLLGLNPCTPPRTRVEGVRCENSRFHFLKNVYELIDLASRSGGSGVFESLKWLQVQFVGMNSNHVL